jgi:hypothetical protein
MATYNPPIENLPIFNVSEFNLSGEASSGGGSGIDYLQFPNAQGNENLQGINVAGEAYFYGRVYLTNTTNLTGDLVLGGTNASINYNDTTEQTSAYTGAGALAGSYTNSDIVIDSDGKITSISNGSGGGGATTTAYYKTGIIGGNTAPLTTPLVFQVDTTTLSPVGLATCPLVFRLTCNLTNSQVPAQQLDAGGVSTFNNTCRCIFNYYPFLSQPVVSGTNVNWMTNSCGTGTTTNNTAYYTPTIYGAYGRPFWTTALMNEQNVVVLFPFTFTGTAGSSGIKQIVFNPPAIGYPSASGFFWEWTIELMNLGAYAGRITTTGFNQNISA